MSCCTIPVTQPPPSKPTGRWVKGTVASTPPRMLHTIRPADDGIFWTPLEVAMLQEGVDAMTIGPRARYMSGSLAVPKT